MDGLVFLLAAAVLVLILLWAFGSIVGRVAGVLLVLDGLGGFVVHGATPGWRYVIELGAGIGLWMFGHWLFAAKHGAWRSRLGRMVWRSPLLAWMAPAP
ncbi:hypothetical protein ACPXB3_11900 [Gordonia sp. DT219]|uniref:hypothetical protein n=1 Tax=Gordonia sp. DT219 TaxID=3416658 RepID=UPI003CF86532